MHFLHKVIGDGEELDNAALSQGSTQRRADEDGASRQLRKRKKLFGREFRRKKLKKKKCPCDLRAHREKYTFCGPCDCQSNTRDPPPLPRLSYLLFAQRNLHRAHPVFCRLRVPSRPAGGRRCRRRRRKRRRRAWLRCLTARQKTSKTG